MKCDNCSGNGYVVISNIKGQTATCEDCHGTGRIDAIIFTSEEAAVLVSFLEHVEFNMEYIKQAATRAGLDMQVFIEKCNYIGVKE